MANPARPNFIRLIHRATPGSRSRTTVSIGACAVALAAASLLLPAGASADPSPTPSTTTTATSASDVQAQLMVLTQKNAQVVEAYDQAQVRVGNTMSQARAASATAVRANVAYARAQQLLSATIAMEYESGAFSATGALLSSDSGQSYLDSINTLSAVSTHSAQVVQTAVAAKATATRAQAVAKSAVTRALAARDDLSRQKRTVEAQVGKLRTTLASITATQRSTYYRISNPSVAVAIPNIPAPNGRAALAVAFAKAQVGKPYVWGASGPNAYDCSGLTMASWRAAGVSLPHSSAQQYGYGTHVPESALQPGDLVFMYSPISHVTIYIGGGLLVSAPQTGQDVSVVPLSAFQNVYAGATRLG